MKILIVHELFPPDFAGGGEKIMYELAKRLILKGHQVKVLTTGKPQIREHHHIHTIRRPYHRYFMNFSLLSVLKYAKNADVIHASSYNAFLPALIAGKILKKPVISYAMGLYGKRWLQMRGPIFGNASRLVEKIQLNRKFTKSVFLSDYSRDWAKEIGITKNTAVVNPGVDLQDYHPGRKEPFVLFVGRFAQQKGVDDIITVAQNLPHINFKMIGWGEEETRLKQIAPPNIKFYNGLNNKAKVIELYSQALVCLFPSVGETFGLVVPEAMASGCAIVSTISLDYAGFQVQPHDTKIMTEKINLLLQNPQLAHKMGQQNLELAKNYDWGQFTDKFIKIYQEVTKKL